MGTSSSSLIYPSIEDIVETNKYLIQNSGGNLDGAGHFHNENSLKWVLDAIQYPFFDVDTYPTISDKAAILAWTIIDGHVFIDGNKRTGFMSMMVFLAGNGFYISAHEDELVNTAIKIATARTGNYTIEEFTEWVRTHLKLLYPSP
ncbi:MAG: type II toxin-antitoxin system death-on-curing family toxin [Chloroflexi bacterium]|nr:MAG: type II toxin-antitoxin system death-on-curing family toxin [Chloroflexota bacterium]